MSNSINGSLSLENIIEHLDGSIICCKNDKNLTIVYASEYFYRTLGYESGEVTALLPGSPDGILQNDPPIDWRQLVDGLKITGFAEQELKLIKKDGHHIWACCRLRLMTAENGEEYLCGILFDVTQKRRSRRREYEQMQAIKKAESELAASEERYRIIMEQAADPIFDFNLLTRQLYFSPSFKSEFSVDFSGETKEEDFIRILTSSDAVHPEDREKFIGHTKELLKGIQLTPGEYRFKNADNRYHWYRVRSTIIKNSVEVPVRIITFITDIDKQKRETMRLKEEAEHDLLTGLYNHVTTVSLIEKAIANSKEGSRHALFVIDIDNFKIANDMLGHLFGDELLMSIAANLKSQFRGNDIIGRMGGDEFVVFLQDIPSEAVLIQKSQLLNEIFRDTRTKGNETCNISCSVGVAIYPVDGITYPELFHKADIAMYSVKNSGKDACCVYTKRLEAADTQVAGHLPVT
jgi:diguanylate cyclase (GGDEF)-like protein/PAS domain S-box-containing protein